MLNSLSVAVIVPAYNEEKRVGAVLCTMPAFVDYIIVVNDGSIDRTKEVVETLLSDPKFRVTTASYQVSIEPDKRYCWAGIPEFVCDNVSMSSGKIVLLSHLQNKGKGSAIKTGYAFARKLGFDCVATMDGDGQMNPQELESICAPIVSREADYVKGDRMSHPDAPKTIPAIRYWGNAVLSALTKPVSGYWGITDTQTGFTAISKSTLERLSIEKIYEYYGYPNDVLVKLNTLNCTIKEVRVQPIYHDISASKMRISVVIPKLSLLLLRSFFWRIRDKYLYKRFHPILLLIMLGFALMGASILTLATGYISVKLAICLVFGSSVSMLIGILWDRAKNKSLLIK